jgi:hypothetical protein
MNRSTAILTTLVLCLVLSSQGSAQTRPKDAPQNHVLDKTLALRDVDGVLHRPLADTKVKALVLIFSLPDCPIANSYAPEIKRLCTEYGRQHISFFLVQVDPELSTTDAKRHAREYGYTCPVVVDREHQLVRRAGATRAPEVAVFAPNGDRKYIGRIDDLYIAPGKRRNEPTSRDLRLALDAVLAGEAVGRPVTQAIGCFIPPLPTKGKHP